MPQPIAQHAAQVLHRLLRRKSETKEQDQRMHYQKLIETAEQMVRQTERVVQALAQQTENTARRVRAQVEQDVSLGSHVIAQTRSRVLEGKKVASADKVLSLLEPHTRAIPGDIGGAGIEFGRQVILDEVDGGIVIRSAILEQPHKHGQAVEAVAHHQQVFGRAPRVVAGDQSVQSADTEEVLMEARAKLVAIPAAGNLSQALERTRRWKRGYRWRAGTPWEDCELEAGLWLAQERLPQARWHGMLARSGDSGQQSAPHRSRQALLSSF